MKLHPRLSRATLELVMRFETFQPQALLAAEGGWTIGYGHTLSAREGAHVSRADGEALLLYDLSLAASHVEQTLFAPVSQREFEALTAFCFNIGAQNFDRSTALARVNAGATLEAADEIERWRHAELGAGAQVVDALVRRRVAEKAHFLGLPEGFSKSPSAVLRPIAGGEAVASDTGGVEPPIVTSATLDAANSVQARLRELVPEPEPLAQSALADPPPPLAAISHAFEVAEPEAPPFPDPDPPLPDEPLAPSEAVRYLPAPPPPPPPALEAEPAAANDVAPPVFPAALDTPVPPPAPAVVPEPELSPVAPPPRAPLKLDRRAAYAVLTGVGACLFVIAVVLILGGKPEFANLGLGVVGALVMAPGVYGLLGPRQPKT